MRHERKKDGLDSSFCGSLPILASILEATNDGMVTLTFDSVITSWNRAAEDIFGYLGEEIIGQSVCQFIPKEKRKELDSFLESVAEGSCVNLETLLRRRRGELLEALLTLSPIKNEGGLIVECLCIARDMSEVQRVKKEMSKLSSVVEQTADLVLLTNKDGVIEYVNPSFESFTGFSMQEVVGKSPSFLKSGQHSQEYYENLWETILKGEVFKDVLLNKKKSGELFYSEKTITPIIDQDGNITHFVSTDRDISKLMKAKSKIMEQAEELTKVNRDLEHFASVVAHDLKQPLQAISLNLSMYLKRYVTSANEDGIKYIHRSNNAILRAQRLIDDFLALSRAGSRARLEPVDCNEVIRQVLLDLRGVIEETDTTITIDVLPTVIAEPGPMAHVFQNLIGNSIKYRGEKPCQISVDAKEKSGHWEFRVRDNGIGIEKKYWDKVFDAFERVQGISSTRSGTGLGLTICKKIIEKYHGKIWVESAPDQGSTFFFTLPQAPQNSETLLQS